MMAIDVAFDLQKFCLRSSIIFLDVEAAYG